MADPSLAEWREFFITTGTIAGTFLGLLFASVSFNVDVVMAGARNHLRQIAEQAYHSYITTVFGALLFAFPGLVLKDRLLALGMLGVVGLLLAGYRLLVGVRAAGRDGFHWVHVVRRIGAATVACTIMVIGGWATADTAQAIQLLGFAAILLLISATASSWDLLVKVAEQRRGK